MAWIHRYRFRTFWADSFWVFPSLGILVTLALVAPLLRWVEDLTQWPWLNLTPDGARTLLSAFTSSMLTFIIFVLSSVLIVVQLAAAAITPRIIAMTFSKRGLRWVLTFFTVAFTYTMGVSSRVADHVPQLPIFAVIVLNLLSIPVFFFFAHRLAKGLRPISIMTAVSRSGSEAIDVVYPRGVGEAKTERINDSSEVPPTTTRVVTYAGPSGTFLSFGVADIVRIARDAGTVVRLVPQVGDFIAQGDPLFEISSEDKPGILSESALHQRVAVGPERTLEQDPRFALRIIVDIANRALSPAVNDPTTAVLAIDQIHRLLLKAGRRNLDERHFRDAGGKVRLEYRTPDWEDYVSLGTSEIRMYGRGSLQVARRLLAMLDHLISVLPPLRHEALLRERMLLSRSVMRDFPDQEDRASAETPDTQGMGGSTPGAGDSENGG